MKKIVFVLIAVMALASCSNANRLSIPPKSYDLPEGFVYVAPAGNRYFLYQAPIGYFLVSSQRQGGALGGVFESNVFIDMVYIGSELKK